MGSSIQVDASFSKLVVGFPNIMDLLKEMVPPDWSYFQVITTAMLDTIRMAIIGTTLGAILAIPLALFAQVMCLLVHFIQSSSIDFKFYSNDTRFIISGNFRSYFWNRILPGILALTFSQLGSWRNCCMNQLNQLTLAH